MQGNGRNHQKGAHEKRGDNIEKGEHTKKGEHKVRPYVNYGFTSGRISISNIRPGKSIVERTGKNTIKNAGEPEQVPVITAEAQG